MGLIVKFIDVDYNIDMLDDIKSILLLIVVLLAVVLLGYWSFSTLQSGQEFAANEKIQELQEENKDLIQQATNLTKELEILSRTQTQNSEPTIIEPALVTPAPVVKEITKPKTYKYQDLIDELEKLVKDNIYMKLGSSGIRVGTVQKFLNIYNNKSNKIDNDYGATTKTAVAVFQKAVGITVDGEAGVGTFGKMIDWLKKQG